MKFKQLSLVISLLCITQFAHAANGYSSSQQSSQFVGDNGYSSSQQGANGYSSSQRSGQSNTTTYSSYSTPVYEQGNVSFSVDLSRHPRFRVQRNSDALMWIDMQAGEPIPRHAVIGGNQSNPYYTLFVCRANFQGGIHPGKLIAQKCNISFGGQEIAVNNYQVLVSRVPLNWVSANYGRIPPNAVVGGYENGRPLYICQVRYRNGTHPGKIVGQNCNIAWGGQEIIQPYYNVLVR